MDLIAGDIVEGKVCDFASEGEGVVKVDGTPVFIPFAIEGEVVRAKVTFAKKDVAFGELIEVVSPSPRRVKPICPYFGRCGGCDLQHMEDSLQLEIKAAAVRQAFKKIAGIEVEPPLPVRFEGYGYRNKLALPFGMNKKSGRVYVGFYEKRSHKVVPIKFCPISGDWAGELIEVVTNWANRYSISVYDEGTHKGLLRHMVARMISTLSLTIVINGNAVPHFDELAAELSEKFEGVTIYLSENRNLGNVIMGDGVRLVYGKPQKQHLGRLDAEISPMSFLQVNDKARDALYDYAATLCEGANGIVELYSGVGLLTAQLATRLDGVKISSVEIVKEAVRDAKKLFLQLGISDRISAEVGDAKDFVRNLSDCGDKTLLLDPPRRGCDQEVLTSAKEAGFEKIVYISCNPQTLARDVKLVSDIYSVENLKLFDMFPQTANIETVALLKKRS